MSQLMTPQEVVEQISDGMTLGIGGWGSRRKPMTLVRAIAASDLKDLTLVSYGGPDVGILCALGKVRKLIFAFVSLDSIPLEPHFRKARQTGSIPELMELDEGMFQLGLRAAAWGLPFLPTRAGQGSDVMRVNPGLKTVTSPYGGEELVAMPALKLDVAIVHMNRGDARGNGQYLGPDPYFDDWFCMAADKAYMSCEKLGLDGEAAIQTRLLNRTMIDGVVEAPGGAWFTGCLPDYPRDEALQREYAATAKDPEAWKQFVEAYL